MEHESYYSYSFLSRQLLKKLYVKRTFQIFVYFLFFIPLSG